MNSLTMHTNKKIVTIGEETYTMDFDMQALSIAEQVYATRYFRPEINVAQIIKELYDVKISACMAFAYGAILSAGQAVPWEKFSKEIFTYEHFDAIFAEVQEAIEALFKTDDAIIPEGDHDTKN